MKKILLPLLLVAGLSVCWLGRRTSLDPALLSKAKQEYRARGSKLSNKRYITVVDYRKNILQDRLYVYDMQKQEVVLKSRVSHAFRSGILYPTRFSNTNGSEQSCFGTFLTGESYTGKYGYSMRVDGVSADNTKSRYRAIVFHPGYFWSAACYMTEPEVNKQLIDLIKGKSLVVVYK